MKVGETYYWTGNGMHELMLFVVVSQIDDYRMSDRDEVDKPGYRLLIIEGVYKSSIAGCTLGIAANCAIASDSRLFV